jgi:DNA-binding MarR family transcriptional regulator
MGASGADAQGVSVPGGETVESLAGDVWRLMAEFSWSVMQDSRAFHHLKALGLTPGHLKVLATLDADEAIPMGSIAETVSVDPSMATWLVDRLEDRKLVERRVLSTDRRVKVVSLTRRGVRVKQRVFAHLLEPPPELLDLGRERLEALRSALAALPRAARPFTHRLGGPRRHQRHG